MILFTFTLPKRRTSAGVRIFSFMTLICITLLGLSACSSSDTADENKKNKTSATLQPLTTTLPGQEPVTLAEGYPQKLIPVMEGTNLRSNTFNKDQGSASLIFDSTTDREKIFSFYSDHFLDLGFAKIPETDGLNNLKEFQRHDAKETASIAITENSDGKQVTTVSVDGVRGEDFK